MSKNNKGHTLKSTIILIVHAKMHYITGEIEFIPDNIKRLRSLPRIHVILVYWGCTAILWDSTLG